MCPCCCDRVSLKIDFNLILSNSIFFISPRFVFLLIVRHNLNSISNQIRNWSHLILEAALNFELRGASSYKLYFKSFKGLRAVISLDELIGPATVSNVLTLSHAFWQLFTSSWTRHLITVNLRKLIYKSSCCNQIHHLLRRWSRERLLNPSIPLT